MTWKEVKARGGGGMELCSFHSSIFFCPSPFSSSVVMPGRTYYMYAETQNEADEWVKLIRAKMVGRDSRFAMRFSFPQISLVPKKKKNCFPGRV